jgi:acyl-CoA reductase-like NAD-dependent aldehyde dehydrogenase
VTTLRQSDRSADTTVGPLLEPLGRVPHADETFGPVVSRYPVDTEDEAISKANDSPFGLNFRVWTSDPALGRHEEFRSGPQAPLRAIMTAGLKALRRIPGVK